MTVPIVVTDFVEETEVGKLTFRGIFTFEKDRLKICGRWPNAMTGPRPTEIPDVPGKDSDLWVIVLEREENPDAIPLGGPDFIKDLTKLQGVWNLVSTEYDGKKKEMPANVKSTLTIDGETVIMLDGYVSMPLPFTLDTAKKPKEITIHFKLGGQEMKERSIYSIEGDELKLHAANYVKAPPPCDFVSKAGTVLHVYKRDQNPAGTGSCCEITR